MTPEPIKLACADCLYFDQIHRNDEHGKESWVEISEEQRKQIRNNAYGWHDNSLLFRCRRGVWDERVKLNEADRYSIFVETDRGVPTGNSCVFYPYHTQVGLPQINTGQATATPPKKGTEPKETIAEVLKEGLGKIDKKLDKIAHGTKAKALPMSKPHDKKVRLRSLKLKFDAESATIKIGGKIIRLVQDSKQHTACRIIFNRDIGKWVSWDIISDRIKGKECGNPTANDRRTVQDAIIQINDKVKKLIFTDDKLFTWSNGKIKRNY